MASLSRPSTFVFPNLQAENPPKKKKVLPTGPPPLTTMPTFSEPSNVRPKPTLKKKKKTKADQGLTASRSFSKQERDLRGKYAIAQNRGACIRLDRATLENMTENEYRFHVEKQLATIYFAVSGMERRRTRDVCQETIKIQSNDKFWKSGLLMREIDREYFYWLMHVVDPSLVWVPPFAHGKEWKAYIEGRVVSGEFIYFKKVEHDLARLWAVARDRRDILDQKKMRIARACAKSYGTALHAIKKECLNEFTALADFSPEVCWPRFASRLVISTGFKKAIAAWLSEVAMEINAKGSASLQLILEASVTKIGKDMRSDFVNIYKQAKTNRELEKEQESYASQGPTQFDWSFL